MFEENEDQEHPFAMAQREAQKAQDIATHELRMRHDRFMDELTKEQLHTFHEICHIMMTNEGYAHFLIGCSSTIMRLKHDTCPCGNDHEKLNAEMLEQTRAEMNIPSQVERTISTAATVDEGLMKEYMLAPNDHGTLSCTGCGMDYQSLDDRMLRNPGMDGCSGCQYKSGHG